VANNKISLFVDGEFVAEERRLPPSKPNIWYVANFGEAPIGSSELGFKGGIDEVMTFTRKLSPEQIRRIFQMTPDEPSIIALTDWIDSQVSLQTVIRIMKP
jgi:hypothetical protein